MLNESIARRKERSKSRKSRRENASYAAKAKAVDMPVKKSAELDKKTVLTVFRLIPQQ